MLRRSAEVFRVMRRRGRRWRVFTHFLVQDLSLRLKQNQEKVNRWSNLIQILEFLFHSSNNTGSQGEDHGP